MMSFMSNKRYVVSFPQCYPNHSFYTRWRARSIIGYPINGGVIGAPGEHVGPALTPDSDPYFSNVLSCLSFRDPALLADAVPGNVIIPGAGTPLFIADATTPSRRFETATDYIDVDLLTPVPKVYQSASGSILRFITIEFIINNANGSDGKEHDVFSLHDGTGSAGTGMRVYIINRMLRLVFTSTGGTGTNHDAYPIPNATTSHVAITFNEWGQIPCFINGVSAGLTGGRLVQNQIILDKLRIGNNTYAPSVNNAMKCKISDFKITNALKYTANFTSSIAQFANH